MLAAERYRKISPDRPASERMEDVLTSHVFSLFRYLNALEIPRDFLCRAANLRGDRLPVGRLRGANVVFWPRFTLGKKWREADVLLLLEEEYGQSWAVLVEAKHESGLHNVEGEEAEAEEGFGSSGHQLADQAAALIHGVWHIAEDCSLRLRQSRRVLLYVTAHHELPRADLEEAAQIAAATPHAVSGRQPAADLYWVSWRELHTLLVSAGTAGFLGYSTGERRFLEDLREVLALRRLREFHPFQELRPVGPYVRLLLSPPRLAGLKPVEPYPPMFKTS